MLVSDARTAILHGGMGEGNRVAERFYFDLTDGFRTLRDDEGVEASDLSHAITQALFAIKEMRQSEEIDQLSDGWIMIVRDQAGVVRQEIVIRQMPSAH